MRQPRLRQRSGASILAMLIAFGATDAAAQTTRELLNEIEALKRKIEALEQKVEQTEATAEEAKDASSGVADVEVKLAPAPTIRSKDGSWSFKVRGRLQTDYNYITADPSVPTGAEALVTRRQQTNTVELRRARLGVEGNVFRDFGYKFELSFQDAGSTGGSSEVEIEDAIISYKGVLDPATVEIGQFKEFATLENINSSRFIRFMERAAFVNAFGFERRLGLGVSANGENWKVGAAAQWQNVSSENNCGPDQECFGGVSVRGHYAADLGSTLFAEQDSVLHAGGSFRWRNLSNDADGRSVRYRARPFFHGTDQRHIDTNFGSAGPVRTSNLSGRGLAENDFFFGPELVFATGPLSVSGEAGFLFGDRRDTNSEGRSGGSGFGPLWGGYIDATYWVTGEDNTYSKKSGVFGRPKVKRPIHEGGFGAVEVGLRLDYLSLEDAERLVQGGEQFSIIPGVNWWLNNYVKVAFNFAYTRVNGGDDPGGLNGFVSQPGGTFVPDGDNDVYGFGLRAQVDW